MISSGYSRVGKFRPGTTSWKEIFGNKGFSRDSVYDNDRVNWSEVTGTKQDLQVWGAFEENGEKYLFVNQKDNADSNGHYGLLKWNGYRWDEDTFLLNGSTAAAAITNGDAHADVTHNDLHLGDADLFIENSTTAHIFITAYWGNDNGNQTNYSDVRHYKNTTWDTAKATWVYQGIVLARGGKSINDSGPYAYNEFRVSHPQVLRLESGSYAMTYTVRNTTSSTGRYKVTHATSSDLATWTAYGSVTVDTNANYTVESSENVTWQDTEDPNYDFHMILRREHGTPLYDWFYLGASNIQGPWTEEGMIFAGTDVPWGQSGSHVDGKGAFIVREGEERKIQFYFHHKESSSPNHRAIGEVSFQ